MKKNLSLEEQLYHLGIYFFAGSLLILLFYFKIILVYFPSFPCMLYSLLGVYCPGCGGTRAILYLLHGNILKSLWYHPIVIYTAIIYLGFMLSHTLSKIKGSHIKGWKFHSWYLYVAMIIIFLNWGLKNYLLLQYHIKL